MPIYEAAISLIYINYWVLFSCLQKKKRLIFSHLDRTSLVNDRFTTVSYWKKNLTEKPRGDWVRTKKFTRGR